MENELSNLESEVDKLKSLLSDDLANIIKDFLKAFRGDLLFNADKQLKHLESELAKLENRLREVNGDNEDFMTLLTKANNDPSDKARVELIALLLDESENDAKKQLKKIKSDKDKMKILLENMRNELRSQNAADVSVATINDILKDSATTAEMIGMRLIELESIYDDI
jgi:helix-turn-helix protein